MPPLELPELSRATATKLAKILSVARQAHETVKAADRGEAELEEEGASALVTLSDLWGEDLEEVVRGLNAQP